MLRHVTWTSQIVLHWKTNYIKTILKNNNKQKHLHKTAEKLQLKLIHFIQQTFFKLKKNERKNVDSFWVICLECEDKKGLKIFSALVQNNFWEFFWGVKKKKYICMLNTIIVGRTCRWILVASSSKQNDALSAMSYEKDCIVRRMKIIACASGNSFLLKHCQVKRNVISATVYQWKKEKKKEKKKKRMRRMRIPACGKSYINYLRGVYCRASH